MLFSDGVAVFTVDDSLKVFLPEGWRHPKQFHPFSHLALFFFRPTMISIRTWMDILMLFSCKNLQVLYSIVKFIAINMVNIFTSRKRTSKLLLHYKTMFEITFFVYLYVSVATSAYATSPINTSNTMKATIKIKSCIVSIAKPYLSVLQDWLLTTIYRTYIHVRSITHSAFSMQEISINNGREFLRGFPTINKGE